MLKGTEAKRGISIPYTKYIRRYIVKFHAMANRRKHMYMPRGTVRLNKYKANRSQGRIYIYERSR